MKTCTKCREDKAVDQFHTDKRSKDGRRHWCKACTNAANGRWNKANRGVVAASARARRAADPEADRAYKAAWLMANPGKGAEYSRAYRERHPERAAEAKRRHREANADRIKELAAAWRASNPDKVTAIDAARRARLFGAVVGDADYEFVKAAYSVCYLCGEPLSGDIHVDHVIPLSRGGAHCTDNLMPTHATCNRRKHDHLLSELPWYSGPADLGISLHSAKL